MILLNNGSSELGANSTFAFLADCENVNGFWHGSEGGDEGKKEMAGLLCCRSQGFVLVCCFDNDALVAGAVDKQEGFHGFRKERLSP